MKYSNTFVEHVVSATGVFITDIWYHEGDGTYSSVLTDTQGAKAFKTLEDIQGVILDTYNQGGS